MAYENYSYVSWTDATPITGARLEQMSINTDQVKDATESSPRGLIKLKEVSSTLFVNTSVNDEYELISLADESPSGPDNRVSIAANRWYRISVNFPGFTINAPGGEDSTYYLSICEGTFGSGTIEQRANYKFQSEAITFIDVSTTSPGVIGNEKVKTSSRLGAGSYSIVVPSSGLTNQGFYVKVGKVAGSSGNNNATTYSVQASATEPLQMYIEDIGGFA